MIHIRIARNDDIPHLAQIYTAAYTNARVGEHWDAAHAAKLLTHFQELQPDLFFIALIDTIPAGAIVGVVKPWWDGNHIADGELFVDPAYQRKGIATQLLKHLINHAGTYYAITAIDWITFSNKEFPLHWYTRLGFTKVKNWTVVSGKPNVILRSINNNNPSP